MPLFYEDKPNPDIEDKTTFLKILIHGKDTEKTKQTQQGALYLLRSTKSKLD